MQEVVVRSGAGVSLLGLLNPLGMLRNLRGSLPLAVLMSRREIQARYRETNLGLLWSVLVPLVLLAVYTFVFGIVFKNNWTADPNESRGAFAVTLFCGMLTFNLFAEVMNRAPVMVTAVPNYVKKVVFPLEAFPVSALLTALFNLLIGAGVWLMGHLLIIGWPPLTCLLLPVVIAPLCLLILGLSWLLASLGVFIRDIPYVVGIILQMLFFMTPVFYTRERVPQPYREFLRLNPLTYVVEDARAVLMTGGAPDPWRWGVSLLGCAVVALLGYTFFMKSKGAFGDVL